MVTSQVTSEALVQLPSVGSWLYTGKNSRGAIVKRKKGYSGRKHTPQSVGHPRG